MSSLEGEGAGGEDTSHPWIGRNFSVKLERKKGGMPIRKFQGEYGDSRTDVNVYN